MNGPSRVRAVIVRRLSISACATSVSSNTIPWSVLEPNGTQTRSPATTPVPSGTEYVNVREWSSGKSTATSANRLVRLRISASCCQLSAPTRCGQTASGAINRAVKKPLPFQQRLFYIQGDRREKCRSGAYRRSLIRAFLPVRPRR